MTLDQGVANGATGTLRWSAGPAAFELVSPDPRVLQRARVVLGPWSGDTGAKSPRARFRVEENGKNGDRTWQVQRVGGESTAARTLDLALAAVEYAAIAALHEPDSGVLTLHAALVSRNARGLLLVGPKEAGKSTLACSLWAAGWRLHADDNALIEAEGRARGTPRRISLRASCRELVGSEVWRRILKLPGTTRTRGGLLFHPEIESNGTRAASVPVAGIVFLARRAATAGPACLEPLDGGRALLSLAPYSNRISEGFEAALRDLQPLADRALAYDLGRGDPAAMVRRAEEVVTR